MVILYNIYNTNMLVNEKYEIKIKKLWIKWKIMNLNKIIIDENKVEIIENPINFRS